MYKKAHASIRENPVHEKKPKREVKKKRYVEFLFCSPPLLLEQCGASVHKIGFSILVTHYSLFICRPASLKIRYLMYIMDISSGNHQGPGDTISRYPDANAV